MYGWPESRCFGCCEMCVYALFPNIVLIFPSKWYERHAPVVPGGTTSAPKPCVPSIDLELD